jgi:hypothetical protein
MEYLSAGANMRNAARQAAAHAQGMPPMQANPMQAMNRMTMQPFHGGMPMGGGLTSHMSDGPGWQPSYGAQPQGPMRSFSSGPMAPSPMQGGMPQMQHFGDGGMARGMMQQPQMPMQQPQMHQPIQYASRAGRMRNAARHQNALSGYGGGMGAMGSAFGNALGGFGR